MFNQESSAYSAFPDARPRYAPHRDEPVVSSTSREVEESYCRQWYRLSVGGVHISLRPSDLEYNELWPEPGATPTELTPLWGRYLLTWWNRAGHTCSSEQRAQQERVLAQVLSTRNVDPVPVAVFSENSSWAEPGLLIEASLADALEAAFILDQQVVVRLEETGVTVIHVGGGRGSYSVLSEQCVPLEIRVSEQAPCPMSRGPESTLPVKRQGGPGTSRGHAVAAMWQEYHQLTHQLVECELHGGSNTPPSEQGRAIALHEIAYPNRFSSMAFLREKDVF